MFYISSAILGSLVSPRMGELKCEQRALNGVYSAYFTFILKCHLLSNLSLSRYS